MAPFFKSSSLFNISRRRRKEQKSLDTFDSSPPTLQSLSLPNMKELHGISSRFLEEFHPILQRQIVCTSSPPNEDTASLEPIMPKLVDPSTLVSSMEILSPESDSPKLDEPTTLAAPFSDPEPISPSEITSPLLDEDSTPRASILCDLENNFTEQDENDSPRLDEQSTPRPAPCSTFEIVSPPENSSIDIDEELASCVSDVNNIGRVGDSTKLDEKIALCEPEPSFESVPSSESNPGELGSELTFQAGDLASLEPITSTNCDLPESPVKQYATFEEPFVTSDISKSIPGLPAITGLNPIKSTRAPQPNAVKTEFMREDESAKFLGELDTFAVFFGVEKPSKTTSTPPFAIRSMLGRSDISSSPTASDCGHKDDPLSSPICGHSEIMESYKREIGFLNQIKANLEKGLENANNKYSKLIEEREMLAEEFNQVQSNFYAERNMNVKLNRLVNTMRFDHLRVLGSQDYEMNQLKRFIAAMVDLKLHTPVLFRAAQSVCNGELTDVALIAAIKEAATKPGSPWANILPAIVGDRPHEIYLDAIKRCAKLDGHLHQANKKYLFWKMKAQMDPRHAKFVTPSSSSMSLVLNACFPKETMELNCIDNLLAKLKTGQIPRRSQPSVPSSPIAGSSKFEGAYVASPSPTHISEESSETVPSKAPVTSSSVLIANEPSEDVPYEGPVASSPNLITEEPSKDELSIVPSPILTPEEPSEDVSCEAPVVSSLILIPEERNEDGLSESVASPQMETSPVIRPSPVLSERSSFTCEAPARIIRHYIPGRALFGQDGFGIAPPGLFDKNQHDESPVISHSASPCPALAESISVSMVRSYVVDNIEHVSYSQEILGLEYIDEIPIDEIPVDGRANPILRDDSDDALVSGTNGDTSEITEVSEPLMDEVKAINLPNSASKRSFSSFKRLSASSSKLKQSISSGLKRLRQITFAPNKAEQAEKPASAASRRMTQAHRRLPSAFGKENRPPNPKHSSTIAPRQRSSIPTRGLRRPTVSSKLKTVQIPPSTTPSSTAPKQQNRVIFESPVISNTLAGKRAPLSNIPVRASSQTPSTNAPRKVLDRGRKAVRTLARLIS